MYVLNNNFNQHILISFSLFPDFLYIIQDIIQIILLLIYNIMLWNINTRMHRVLPCFVSKIVLHAEILCER